MHVHECVFRLFFVEGMCNACRPDPQMNTPGLLHVNMSTWSYFLSTVGHMAVMLSATAGERSTYAEVESLATASQHHACLYTCSDMITDS